MNKTIKMKSIFLPRLPHANSVQVWMDNEHRFIAANDSTVKLFGYAKLDSMLGKQPEHMKCQAVECAALFVLQNEIVMANQKPLIILDIHPYADGSTRTFMTTKCPLYDQNGKIFAVECQCVDIEEKNMSLFLSRLLSMDKIFNAGSANQTSYLMSQSNPVTSLSRREEECLFYVIRGFSMKQIAKLLSLKPKTVESYIENIKSKFGCTTKQQLIECAIVNGLIPFIPRSLFGKANLSIILTS